MVMRMAESQRARTQSRQTTRTAQQDEVVVRARPKIIAATAEELGIKLTSGQMANVPDDIRESAHGWMEDYKASLINQTQLYVEQMSALRSSHNGGLAPEEGEPTVNNYIGWDLLTISPIQFEALPPYRPDKIVASGELALLLALLFINPLVSVPDGFAIPPTVQLGSRNVRVSFDQLNLTHGTPGPSFVFAGNLGPAPVPSILLFPVFFVAPPVTNPELVEVNVTADITDLGQPYAAFADWHIDIEETPPFLIAAPATPQLEYDIPQRYMIYPK